MKPTTTIFAGVPAFCWMLCLGMGWHGCWCRRTSGAVAHSLRRPLLFHSPRRQSRASCYTTSKRRDLASATAAATTTTDNCDRSQHRRPSVDRVCVVGGGLAGLSVTYHLLQKTLTPLNITIVDRVETVGTGGASAVAGGLLHPLSPRGKLVHWGLEGLSASNRLMKAANEAVARKGGDTFAIRDNLVRVATTNEHVHQLQQTAVSLPSISQWLDADEVQKKTGCQTLGGLFMHNGCRVVHVPLYLAGLYTACQDLAGSTQSSLSWKEVGNNELESPTLPQLDNENDTVVYCGGAGMFSSERRNGTISLSGDEFGTVLFPAQLVRGQSLELRLEQPLSTAFVCGKYVSPLLPSPQGDPCSVVVGATHEFQAEPLSIDKVVEEMQKRTSDFCGADWIRNAEIKRSTMGYRVQSNRGMYGRRPIVGRLDGTDGKKASWIFSGLGSRGLLYHGLYGDMLSDAILLDNEEVLTEFCPDFLWWKK